MKTPFKTETLMKTSPCPSFAVPSPSQRLKNYILLRKNSENLLPILLTRSVDYPVKRGRAAAIMWETYSTFRTFQYSYWFGVVNYFLFFDRAGRAPIAALITWDQTVLDPTDLNIPHVLLSSKTSFEILAIQSLFPKIYNKKNLNF